MDYVVNRAAARAFVDDLRAGTLLGTGAELMLYQNDLTPTPQTLLADLTEATFGGYSRVTLGGWGTAYTDDLGEATTVAPLAEFFASGVAPSNLIYGYAVVNGTSLILAGRFDAAPIPMEASSDALIVVPRFSLGS